MKGIALYFKIIWWAIMRRPLICYVEFKPGAEVTLSARTKNALIAKCKFTRTMPLVEKTS